MSSSFHHEPGLPRQCRHTLASLVVVAVFAIVAGPVMGQGYQRAIGTPFSDTTAWVQPTSDGGYVLVGDRNVGGNVEPYIVKLTAAGDVVWDAILVTGPAVDKPNRVIEDADGGYVVAGETKSAAPGSEIYLAKVSAAGTVMWVSALPGTAGVGGGHGGTGIDLVVDPFGGGYVLCGRIRDIPEADQAPLILRVSGDGTLIWARYYWDLGYGVDTVGSFHDVHTANDGIGGFIVVGSIAGLEQEGGRDSLIARINVDGTVAWAKTVGPTDANDLARGLDLAANGDYLVTGFTKAAPGHSTYLLRLDSQCTLLWYRAFDFEGNDSIEETIAGDIILCGRDETSGTNAALINTAGSGAFQWGWSYGDAPVDLAHCAIPTPDGGSMTAATTYSFGAGLSDLYVIKGDATGASGCWETPFSPPAVDQTHPIVDRELREVPITSGESFEPKADGPASQNQSLCGCVEAPACMVGWWPLDETSGPTAEDLIYGNNGTHTNGPSPLAGSFVDNSLCLDGISQYVNVPDAPAHDMDGHDFSIDAWINRGPGAGVRTIVDKREESGEVRGYSLFLVNGTLGFQLADGAHTNYVSSFNVPANEWHHITVTVDRDDPAGLFFYLDGAQDVPFDPTGRPGSLSNARPLRIGSRSSSVSGLYEGCVDEVEIFKRVLSQAEIQTLVDAGPLGKCKDLCLADLDGDGTVGFGDLLILLSSTGICPPCCPADLNGDGVVGFADLIALLGDWGQCR